MIQSKSDYQYYLKKDKENGTFDTGRISFLINDTWRFLRLLRRTEYLTNTKSGPFWKVVLLFNKWRFKQISKKLGYSIPPNVVGPGLCLPHYGNIVINRKVRIGKNCKIHIGVNIGASYEEPDAVPTIGDNCYIAPGAKLFGAISIADIVKIGANAVVNKSCDVDGAVLVGIPAKILKTG